MALSGWDEPALGKADERLTIWVVLSEFGFMPFVLMGIGGLSLIDILEQGILFHSLSLITPFQMVLDGYHRVTRILGAIFEPVLDPTINWIAAHLHLPFHLSKQWRSIFVLFMIPMIALSRSDWKTVIAHILEGRRDSYSNPMMEALLAIWATLQAAFVALVAAVFVTLVAQTPAWWVQGAVSPIPMAVWVAAIGIRNRTRIHKHTLYLLPAWAMSCTLLVTLGSLIALVPGFARSASTIVITIAVAYLGASALYNGLRAHTVDDSAHELWQPSYVVDDEKHVAARLGLSILGGFAAADLILFANWVVFAIAHLM